MATQEEVELVVAHLNKSHPIEFFRTMNENQAGIGAVLRFLYEAAGTVTAGRISEFMGVSTARVAVLLKKMEAKGLIEKERAAEDARVTIVRLSEAGETKVLQMQEALSGQINTIIDKVGMEKLLEFIATSEKIRDAVRSSFDLKE